VEKGEPMHAVGHIMENLILLRFLKKLKIEWLSDPVTLFLRDICSLCSIIYNVKVKESA
jgi:hypothetical protein